MEDYNENSECLACANQENNSSKYIDRKPKKDKSGGKKDSLDKNDRSTIERKCNRCGYVWYEIPLHLGGD